MVTVSGVPARFSRTSLRKKSARDGYGPSVSLGVTAHALFVETVSVIPLDPGVDAVVPSAALVVGLAGLLPPHAAAIAAPAAAPSAASTSLRLMSLFDGTNVA